MPRSAVAAFLLALSVLVTAVAAPSPPPDFRETVDTGLRLLHQGEYGGALDLFAKAAAAAPDEPAPRFYLVFSRWWQMVFAESREGKTDTQFDTSAEAAVAAAQARLALRPGDAPALAAMGGAHVLRSHVEAVRGNYFRCGQEARKGKRALEQALRQAPNLDTALFPLGALNYFADRVPLLVKGLRPLFFFPGGDARLGLQQIRKVADGPGPFRTDGRLLLGQVCADRYQRCYRDALGHLRLALQDSPGSPLISAAIGDLHLRLGEYASALAVFDKALQDARGEQPEKVRQRRWLHVGRAEAFQGAWRLVEAQEALQEARRQAVSSPALLRLERRVEEELGARLAGAPFLTERSGRLLKEEKEVASLEALDAAVRARPDSAVPSYLRGRAMLQRGRATEALASLDAAAARALNAPPWLAGWIEIDRGRAEELRGDRRAARTHFERAAGLKKFRAADRARLELGDRGEHAALCALP